MADHFNFVQDFVQTEPWLIPRHVYLIAEIGINHNEVIAFARSLNYRKSYSLAKK